MARVPGLSSELAMSALLTVGQQFFPSGVNPRIFTLGPEESAVVIIQSLLYRKGRVIAGQRWTGAVKAGNVTGISGQRWSGVTDCCISSDRAIFQNLLAGFTSCLFALLWPTSLQELSSAPAENTPFLNIFVPGSHYPL